MRNHIISPEHMQVTQANELATAAYSMSLMEKRLVLLVMSMIRKDDPHMKCYRFPAKDVLNFLGLRSNKDAYRELRKTTKNLVTRAVDIDLEGDGDYIQFQWMSYARYISAEKSEQGYAELELQVHSMMKPFLLELREKFSSLPFAEIAQLPSYHSIRLFEILWAQSHQGQRPRIYLELSELKTMLDVEKNYPNFYDFKRRVIDKAKRDLSEKTPVKFTYETKKQGRKVVGVWFVVVINDSGYQLGLNLPQNLSVTELPPRAEINFKREHTLLLERMTDTFGLTEKRANELLSEYEPEAIERNLNYAEKQYKAGKVKRLAPYAARAIIQDFQKKNAAPGQVDQPTQTPEDAYNDARSKFIDETINDFGYEELAEEFEPHLLEQCENSKFLAEQFKIIDKNIKNIRDNSVVRSNFRTFILENYAPAYMQSFEVWQERQTA